MAAFTRMTPEPLPQPRSQAVKLLLVDDNQENLTALEAALTPLCQEVYMANSGPEALRLCLDHDFAAVLLDVRMPGMDGFETAQLIRGRPRSRHTPILFLTAYRSDEHLFRGYDLGAVDFLFKPILPEILQSKVSVFVELTRNAELLRQQAARLAKAEKQMRHLLEAAPDAMVITDQSGEMLLVNSRADELFGYPTSDLDGRRFDLLVPEWRCPELPSDLEDDDMGISVESRLTGRRRDGSTFPADVTTSLLSTDGTVLVTSAIRDMTQQVRAQRQLEQLNAQLENIVAARTEELTRSNLALRQFAWAASHDLQEPLRMIIIYSQWLTRNAGSKLEGKECQFLDVVQSNAVRMERLLNALRQYLLVNDTAVISPEPVDCQAVVSLALENLKGIIEETNARIDIQPLPTVPSVEILMVQVFQNLLGNAIKYRSERPPEIVVSAQRANREWVFSVQDNGMGIEPQYLEYIFGVFKRLDGNSGAGMGLAICRAAVERLGGRIWAESQPGAGSCFRFALPERADS